MGKEAVKYPISYKTELVNFVQFGEWEIMQSYTKAIFLEEYKIEYLEYYF